MTKAKNASETMAIGYNCQKMVVATEYNCQTYFRGSWPQWKIVNLFQRRLNLVMATGYNCQIYFRGSWPQQKIVNLFLRRKKLSDGHRVQLSKSFESVMFIVENSQTFFVKIQVSGWRQGTIVKRISEGLNFHVNSYL